MITLKRIVLLAAFAVTASATSAQSLAFTDVTVIDVTEGTAVSGRTVIVTGDRIAAVGDTATEEIPDGATAQRQAEFEPFSLTYFWHGVEREVTFEPGVLYTLRVQPGAGATSGRYVVVFAGPEQFKAGDIVDTLWQLPLIWFGAYGGAPLRWNWLALIPLGLTVGVVAVAVAGVRSRLSRRRNG